jgi:hypothetical protein
MIWLLPSTSPVSEHDSTSTFKHFLSVNLEYSQIQGYSVNMDDLLEGRAGRQVNDQFEGQFGDQEEGQFENQLEGQLKDQL